MIIIVLLFIGVCGTILIAHAINILVVRNQCTEKVMAHYVTCKTNKYARSVLPDTYTPCFTYWWNGTEYHAMPVGAELSKKRIMEFQSDRQYEVYIDPRHPGKLRLNVANDRAWIMDLIGGITCYGLVLIMMLLLLVEMLEN